MTKKKNSEKESLFVVGGREIRRGRPVLEDSEKKSVIVQLRVSREEREQIAEKAEKEGLTLAQWIRGKLFT